MAWQLLEVPLITVQPDVPVLEAEATSVPGAHTSMHCPQFEKYDLESSTILEATVMMDFVGPLVPPADAGDFVHASPSSLPAATDRKTPASAMRRALLLEYCCARREMVARAVRAVESGRSGREGPAQGGMRARAGTLHAAVRGATLRMGRQHGRALRGVRTHAE